MNAHVENWTALTSRLAENHGPAYDPERREELRARLLTFLSREVTHVSKDVLVRALDGVLKKNVTLDWHRFLCLLLSSLPGHWVKVANNPGFGASTMLLLTDGTVMCQEEGGVRWKKLTPDV